MSKRKLPAADVSARSGAKSGMSPKALDRWAPDLRAAVEDDANISILDVIGEDWWSGEGVTAKRISAALRSIGDEPVTVNINSPGGDFFEGLAIYELLRQHPAKVTVKILGLAASAASVIAMAGDEVKIGRSGFLMIHNAWVMAAGDRNDLQEVADWLTPFDATMADIFAARTGMASADVAALLDRETWIGGADAVEQGFADAILEPAAVTHEPEARDTREVVARHKVDILLAKAGVSRSERREMIAALKGGMPGAALSGTHDAAVVSGLNGLINQLRAI